MDWKMQYTKITAYLNTGMNQLSWAKSILAITAYGSMIAWSLGLDAAFIGAVLTILVPITMTAFGYVYLEKLRMKEVEVEYANSLHKGIKTSKK